MLPSSLLLLLLLIQTKEGEVDQRLVCVVARDAVVAQLVFKVSDLRLQALLALSITPAHLLRQRQCEILVFGEEDIRHELARAQIVDGFRRASEQRAEAFCRIELRIARREALRQGL